MVELYSVSLTRQDSEKLVALLRAHASVNWRAADKAELLSVEQACVREAYWAERLASSVESVMRNGAAT